MLIKHNYLFKKNKNQYLLLLCIGTYVINEKKIRTIIYVIQYIFFKLK